MTQDIQLQPSSIAMVSLAAGIAANHPAMGQCQLKKLRAAGVPETQIETVIEIARHIRDEAGSVLDMKFDERAGVPEPKMAAPDQAGCGCSTTDTGQTCC